MFTCQELRDCERDCRTLNEMERHLLDMCHWTRGGYVHRMPPPARPAHRYRHPALLAHALALTGLPTQGAFTEAQVNQAIHAYPRLSDHNTRRRLMVDDAKVLTRDKAGEVYEMTDRGRALRELADAVGLCAWR